MTDVNLSIGALLRPELTEINRLASRPPLCPYPTAALARRGEPSAWRRSLDGAWRFQLVDRPEDAPDRWMLPETTDTDWGRVVVPGCWTRQGTGDLPHYTNVSMPWPGLEPPETPRRNPTGLHRTTFRIPRAWKQRDVIVHLGGAESVALVWCNGVFVGMGKDSRLPSEFDVTPHLTVGSNLLAVMVIRYSDATWIEDQDHWWHAGLHRSAHLEARGRSRIDDLAIVADFDPADRTGQLTVKVTALGASASAVRTRLESLRGRKIAEATAVLGRFYERDALHRMISAYVYEGPSVTVSLDAGSVNPWSAEAPDRSRVICELLDADGGVIEAHATLVGFRRVEVQARRLLVNGEPIMIHGVNRHDHHPVTGKTLTVEELRDDVVAMKRHNINAVRTAHYPNDHRFLDLCDEFGLYVIDEANCESHARLASLSHDPRYAIAIFERTRRMVLRDRNHPCIIGWSLGNESGDGAVFDAAAGWVRRTDPTRFVQYEGAVAQRFGQSGASGPKLVPPSRSERHVTDIVCPMYETIETMVAWAQWAETTELDDRPLIQCEFSHAMGNSNGSLNDYVEAFHNHRALAGGFLWDWRDQGLAEVDERGRDYWAYGGHFGENIHDANFCINGLVGPDLTPNPGLREYMWAIRPVTAEHADGRRIRLTNRRCFTSTVDLELVWETLVDGEAVEGGVFAVDLDPGRSKTISIPARVRPVPDRETHLNLTWRTLTKTRWAPKGHVVAWDQISLNEKRAPNRGPTVAPTPCRFELSESGLRGVWAHGEQVVLGDVTATLWRAPTDNDGAARTTWDRLGLDHGVTELISMKVSNDGGSATLHRRVVFDGGVVTHRTDIAADEGVRFRERIDVPEDWTDLARVGVRFEAPAAMDHLSWFGLGPDETYPDRRSAATVGLWRSRVCDQYHPFARPQEHGSHSHTRWFALRDDRGTGFSVVGDDLFAFAARAHHDRALTAAQTLAELDPARTTEVHVDVAMRGLGTGACGPDTLPEFLVRGSSFEWSWTIHAG